MENISKSNLHYQLSIISKDFTNKVECLQHETDFIDLDCDDLIEKLEGIKEIQIAFKTLTN